MTDVAASRTAADDGGTQYDPEFDAMNKPLSHCQMRLTTHEQPLRACRSDDLVHGPMELHADLPDVHRSLPHDEP